jgi:cytochrome c oxidase assembly protein subunit 15
VLVPLLWWRALATPLAPSQRLACHVLLAALALQVTLGIATLLTAVPVSLGAAHQGGAVLLLAAAIWAAQELGAGAAAPERGVACASAPSLV